MEVAQGDMDQIKWRDLGPGSSIGFKFIRIIEFEVLH